MRIHVAFADRVGITQEVLAILGARNLNLEAVEMAPPNVFIDAPELHASVLAELRTTLLMVPGVHAVEWVDILPGDRRRLQLDTILAAMADPTVAVDERGRVLLANPAFCRAAGISGPMGALSELLGDPELVQSLIDKRFKAGMREVVFQGSVYLMETTPVSNHHSDAEAVAGALIAFYPPSRMGQRLTSMQHEQGLEALMGNSKPMCALKHRIQKLAVLEAPLLIRGETGTGKELVARACHSISGRRDAPFLALNCAALPESLAESELFGYSAGAFTGAQRGGKPGLLELSDGGTVFLDEVGEMSPYLQAKLLRFLNDSTFRRVGGDREVKVNVRILAATHRDLEELVVQGKFREDLFYRLNVLSVQVPPLRERGLDILLLANHFLFQSCAQIGGLANKLAKEAEAALLSTDWPGNVRQLQNVIFRAVATVDSVLIDATDLEFVGATLIVHAAKNDSDVDSLDGAIQRFERDLLGYFYPQYPSTRLLAERLKTSHTAIGQRLRKYGIGKKA
jgi:TyrR family helix-turn-helix protein